MIIVKKHMAFDPDSGLSAPVPHLEDGTYPDLKIVGPPPQRALGRRPWRDDLCNPEPIPVRGFNTIGNY